MNKSTWWCLAVSLLFCVMLASASSRDASADEPKTMVVKGPLSPDDSLKHLVLSDPNLVIEIVATEPEVIDPVSIQFDEHGRLWVVEMRDYPTGPKEAPPPLGGPDAKPLSRIKLLEDKDGDGRFETAHVFAENLLFATGVQPWDGGVIVTHSGEIVYLKDTDGDHKADVREVWFTGFSEQNTQLRANHPTFGPDGWIYVANGLRGGNVIAVKKAWPVKVDGRRSMVDGNDKKNADPQPSTINHQPSGVSHDPANPVPVSLTGRDFKFDPLTGRYEAISGNGQHGMTFDAWGNRFVCDNRHPCRHVIFEEDFIRRCPHVAFPAVVNDVIPADDKNQVFPLTSAWTTSNLHAGTFTAACGVCVYTGDWLPEEFRGNVFVCEPTGNLVQRAILEPDGVTFESKNPYVSGTALAAGHVAAEPPARNAKPQAASAVPLTGREFLASRDDWFRPVDLQNGPDGALYVVDMYRAVIEHPEWVPDELKKRPDTWLGNDMGRIYRIRNRRPKSQQPELDLLRSKPFVFLTDDHVDSDNDGLWDYDLPGWYRPTASRLLHEIFTRGDGMAILAEAYRVSSSRSDPSERVLWNPELSSTIWRSPRLSKLLSQFSASNVTHKDDGHVLLWPVVVKRLTEQLRDETTDSITRDRTTMIAIQTLIRGLCSSKINDAAFPLQAIQSWHELAASVGAKTALTALHFHSGDPWINQAILASNGDRPVQLFSALPHAGFLGCGGGGPRGGFFDVDPIHLHLKAKADFLGALGELVGKSGTRDELTKAIVKLCDAGRPDFCSFQVTSSGILGIAKGVSRRSDELNGPLHKISSECAAALAKIAPTVIRNVQLIDRDNPHWSLPRQQIAIRLLRHLNDDRANESLKKLVENSDDQTIRLTALESFASFQRPEIDAWLVEHYRSETPAIRRAILAALFASKERQLRLLEVIEKGQIAATELGPVQVNQLTGSKDEAVRERAKTILAAAAPASRKEVLEAYQPALALMGDAKRGRELFVKNCSTCHRVDNVGVNVAPDISDTRTKKPEQLLLDILDPNKAIDANYFAYAVVTKEGKVESGVISSESSNSITLKQPEGKTLTLLRSDIDELKNTGLSLMPVGVEKNLDQQALADLIFWLKNWRYLDGKVPATSLK